MSRATTRSSVTCASVSPSGGVRGVCRWVARIAGAHQTQETAMSARSRTRFVGASVAVLAALTATFIAWPGTSGAAVVPQARADLVNASGDPLGSVIFLGRGGHATQVRVELDVPETGVVLNDFHGLHVHANG